MEVNFTKQNFNSLKGTHPDLYLVISKNFKELNDEEKGKIAGLCIEYVIQSEGSDEVFQEDIALDETMFIDMD